MRERFREEMTAVLHRQEPDRRVIHGDQGNPGMWLDPSPSYVVNPPYYDTALPDIEPSITRRGPVLPQQAPTSKELVDVSTRGRCRQCGISSINADLELIECGHFMCVGCILQWFAIGLYSPIHVTPLCISCDSSLSLVRLPSCSEKIGISHGAISFWNEYAQFRRKTTWSCGVESHPPQTLHYEPSDPMSWRQRCMDCCRDYCLRCGSEWHDRDSYQCQGVEVANKYYDWLEEHRHLTDRRTSDFLSRAIVLANHNATRPMEESLPSNSDDNYDDGYDDSSDNGLARSIQQQRRKMASRPYIESFDDEAAPSTQEQRHKTASPPKRVRRNLKPYIEGFSDDDGSLSVDKVKFVGPADYRLFSLADRRIHPDRFARFDGFSGEAKEIEGWLWEDVRNWVMTRPLQKYFMG
jgi:hypothetical protein